MNKIFLLIVFITSSLFAKAQVYGPFYGLNLYGYKSNLFNSDDFRADSFQTYKMTPSFAGNFEIGYLYESGFSVSSGLQFGSNNQKYEGSNNYYTYDLSATTKMSFLKIPIVFGIQKQNDKKLKFLYSLGFYYSYNTGYSDKIELTNKVPDANGLKWKQTIDINKETYSYENNYDTSSKKSYTMDKSPYQKHGLGTIAAIGIRYQLKEKLELVSQLRGEFLITNAEITQDIRFTPKNDPTEFPYSGHAFNNYAKHMNDPKTNFNRASTHPFNIGLTVGIRYYLFDF